MTTFYETLKKVNDEQERQAKLKQDLEIEKKREESLKYLDRHIETVKQGCIQSAKKGKLTYSTFITQCPWIKTLGLFKIRDEVHKSLGPQFDIRYQYADVFCKITWEF